MSEPTFYCYSCGTHKAESLKVSNPSGRCICARCNERASRNTNAGIVRVKSESGTMTLAAQKRATGKAKAKSYREGKLPWFAKS
jgi:transcription elongation factor Elf1